MEESLLSLRNVDIRFGKRRVVKNACFDMKKGKRYPLLGSPVREKPPLAEPSSGSIPVPPERSFTKDSGSAEKSANPCADR